MRNLSLVGLALGMALCMPRPVSAQSVESTAGSAAVFIGLDMPSRWFALSGDGTVAVGQDLGDGRRTIRWTLEGGIEHLVRSPVAPR